MKNIIVLFLGVFFFFCSANASPENSSKDNRAKLTIEGYVKQFYVSEAGNIYILTESRDKKFNFHLYKSNLLSPLWSVTDLTLNGYVADNVICELAGNVLLIGNDYWDKRMILRSKDGGTSFKRVGPKYGGCVYETWTDGKANVAFITGYTQLLFSKNAGLTWTESHFSNDKNDWDCGGCHYPQDVYFDPDGQNGWVCDDKNRLYHTSDGGKNFQNIATPKDQLNLVLTYQGLDVTRFRHIGKHYFVMQGNYVYHSASDSINWQRVDSISAFNSTANGGLIAVTTNGNLVACDANLHFLWKQPMANISGRRCYSQNKLFVLTPNNDICVIDKNGVNFLPKFVNKNISYSEKELKKVIHATNGRDYMINNGDLTCFDKSSGNWQRIVTHPSKLDYWINGDSVLCVIDEFDNKFIVDGATQKLVPFTPDLSDLKKLDVVGFALIKHEVGYPVGCHGPYVKYSAIAPYRLVGNSFVRTNESVIADFLKKYNYLNVDRDTSLLKGLPQYFAKNDIDELKSLALNAMVGGRDSFTFKVSPSDIDSCKKVIENDWHNFESDRKLYKSYIDTAYFGNMSTDFLHNVFSERTNGFKGSSNLSFVVFQLSNGEYFFLYNGDAWRNYMDSPCYAYYKEEPFDVKNINVGIKLNDITEGCFVRCKDKSFALYKIVEYMVKSR